MRSNMLQYLTFSIWLLWFTAPCLGGGLKCYVCVSNKSWEECEEKKEKKVCHPHHNDVCIKQHMVEHSEDTEKGYKEYFIKMCGTTDLCTNKHCKLQVKYCKIDCCHDDLCNLAETTAAQVTITLFGTLAVFILHFVL